MTNGLVSFDSPKPKKRHYAKSVLIKESQFSFKKGSNACTYISLEASLYALNGFAFADDPNLPAAVLRVLEAGTKMDQGLGCTSCEQVMDMNARFKRYLRRGNLVVGKLRDDDVFKKLLDLMKSKSDEEPQCVILTKPPETIALFFQPKNTQFPFAIFDSHPRSYEPKLGAGFYFFEDIKTCNEHLMSLFHEAMHSAKMQAPPTEANGLDPYHQASKIFYDATFVALAPNETFEEARFHDGVLVMDGDDLPDSSTGNIVVVDETTDNAVNVHPVHEHQISPMVQEKEAQSISEEHNHQEVISEGALDVDYKRIVRELMEKNAFLERENQYLKDKLNDVKRILGEVEFHSPPQ